MKTKFTFIKSLALSLGALLFNSSAYSQNCAGNFIADTYSNVSVYTTSYSDVNPSLMIDIYVADGNLNSNKPVIIFAFGGGFISGNRQSDEIVMLATEFAKKGYLCASIDYTLATPSDLSSQTGSFMATLNATSDAKAAIRFFRKDALNSNLLGIDPNSIFFGGTSSGGIMALQLAYMNKMEELSPSIQFLISQYPGGLEGMSGNSGYCSSPNGIFSFAGAILDTNFIETDDIPCFTLHSINDTVVPYQYGLPSNGNTPLFGSKLINERLSNADVYNQISSISGNIHPSFNTNNPLYNYTLLLNVEDKLSVFLNDIMHCNESSNEAYSGSCGVISAISDKSDSEFDSNSAYPNPFTDIISFKDLDENLSYSLYDISGKVVMSGMTSEKHLNTSKLNSGIYFMVLSNENTMRNFSFKLIKN